MGRGRPTKCTEKLIEDFGRYMSSGLFFEDACDLCGISYQSGYNYLNWGEEALDEADNDIEQVPEDKRIYAQFFDAIRAESAKAVARSLAYIQQAAGDDWRAAESFLKMRKPDTWGQRKQQLEHTGAGGGPVEVSWLDAVAEECAGDEEGEADASDGT